MRTKRRSSQSPTTQIELPVFYTCRRFSARSKRREGLTISVSCRGPANAKSKRRKKLRSVAKHNNCFDETAVADLSSQPSLPLAPLRSQKQKNKISPAQSKHVGTGHADTSRFEWAVNMHRDTAAAFAGHAHLTNYLAVATNEHPARVRAGLLAGMLLPCGLPPAPPGQEEDEYGDEEGAAAAAAKKKAAKKRKK